MVGGSKNSHRLCQSYIVSIFSRNYSTKIAPGNGIRYQAELFDFFLRCYDRGAKRPQHHQHHLGRQEDRFHMRPGAL